MVEGRDLAHFLDVGGGLTLSDKAGKERYVIQFLPPLGVHIHFVQVFVQFSW